MIFTPTEIWIGFGIWAVIFISYTIYLVHDDAN